MSNNKNLALLALTTLVVSSSIHPMTTSHKMLPHVQIRKDRAPKDQGAQLVDILKRDDLTEFKKFLAKSVPSSILREAENKQAKKIVNFLINNSLVDFDKDPASLTWFALWRPSEFNRLISSQMPSNKALDGALDALDDQYFAVVKPEEKTIARELLIGAGAMTKDQRSLPSHV